MQIEACKGCKTKGISTFKLHFEMIFMKDHPYFSKTLPCITMVSDAELPYGAEVMGKKIQVYRSYF